jgi:hypothetical protein
LLHNREDCDYLRKEAVLKGENSLFFFDFIRTPPRGHSRQLKESEKGFTGQVNKGKRIFY